VVKANEVNVITKEIRCGNIGAANNATDQIINISNGK